jgi:hypothetical protein
MPPAKLIRCENCNEHKPAKDFPPSPMSPAGSLPKCMDCVRSAARAQRAQAQITFPPVAQGTAAPLPPHLVQAAVRFVAEHQPGIKLPIDADLEPEFRNLLLWVRYLSRKEAIAPMTAEEIGREILNYKDDRTARGVTYGTLLAALARASSIYEAEDARRGRLPRKPRVPSPALELLLGR